MKWSVRRIMLPIRTTRTLMRGTTPSIAARFPYFKENNLRPPQFITGELQMSRILRAVYSERQLQEVMVDFWTNHFNVFAGKGADRWLLTSYDRDTIRPHTMGKFHDLLRATAAESGDAFLSRQLSECQPERAQQQRPAKCSGRAATVRRIDSDAASCETIHSSNRHAAADTAAQRRGINENYARELMELHTLGVDGGYTQKDVQEVARCFTGWTIFAPRGGARPPQCDR